MGGGFEEVAGEAALAEAGADGGEMAEEGVGAEDVEVAFVEVVGGAQVLAGLEAGAAGLRLGAVGAGKVAVVEDEQALLAGDLGLLAEQVPDEGDGGGEGDRAGVEWRLCRGRSGWSRRR